MPQKDHNCFQYSSTDVLRRPGIVEPKSKYRVAPTPYDETRFVVIIDMKMIKYNTLKSLRPMLLLWCPNKLLRLIYHT